MKYIAIKDVLKFIKENQNTDNIAGKTIICPKCHTKYEGLEWGCFFQHNLEFFCKNCESIIEFNPIFLMR